MMKVAREMIAEGKIGKIAAVNAEYVQEWLIDELGVPGEGTTKLSVWRAIRRCPVSPTVWATSAPTSRTPSTT